MTGWNLPPGCTDRMIDEAAGIFDVCNCCGYGVDDCVCPECPVCNSCGDPECHEKHGLPYTKEQRIGQARRRITDLEAMLIDEKYYLSSLMED